MYNYVDSNGVKVAKFIDKNSSFVNSDVEVEKNLALSHNKYGNDRIAKRLGHRMAQSLILKKEYLFCNLDDEFLNNYENEILLLITFTVGVEVANALKDEILAQIVKNSFYDFLQKECPSLSPMIYSSIDYSYYLLAYRRGGDIERNIGKVFSTICNNDEDATLMELGEVTYCRTVEYVDRTIRNTTFVEI